MACCHVIEPPILQGEFMHEFLLRKISPMHTTKLEGILNMNYKFSVLVNIYFDQ